MAAESKTWRHLKQRRANRLTPCVPRARNFPLKGFHNGYWPKGERSRRSALGTHL